MRAKKLIGCNGPLPMGNLATEETKPVTFGGKVSENAFLQPIGFFRF